MKNLTIITPNKKGDVGLIIIGNNEIKITFHSTSDGGCYPDKLETESLEIPEWMVEQACANAHYQTWPEVVNGTEDQRKSIFLVVDSIRRRGVFPYGIECSTFPDLRPRFSSEPGFYNNEEEA